MILNGTFTVFYFFLSSSDWVYGFYGTFQMTNDDYDKWSAKFDFECLHNL